MADERKNNQLGLRLDPELRAALEREADEIPLATYITALLKRYVRDGVVRRPPRVEAE
jgi:hypothetical protein